MPIAALIGTTVGYTDYYQTIVLEKNDGSVAVVSRKTFDYLYFRLDEFRAAMKDDCIHYASNDPMIDLYSQPDWYIDICSDGLFYEHCGVDYFYEEDGEVAVSPSSVILRNYQGDLKYMELDEFTKYYDIPGSEFIE